MHFSWSSVVSHYGGGQFAVPTLDDYGQFAVSILDVVAHYRSALDGSAAPPQLLATLPGF